MATVTIVTDENLKGYFNGYFLKAILTFHVIHILLRNDKIAAKIFNYDQISFLNLLGDLYE